jgi:5-methyltetrahydropteroyltriglutamate--homocysteine methyltransferase
MNSPASARASHCIIARPSLALYPQIPGTESVEFYSGKIYYLDYDTLRGGNFDALELLPATKNVVLGLVTTTRQTRRVKSKGPRSCGSDSQRRRFVGRELLRIGVSPQCGFASALTGNSLIMDEMAAKLSLVRQLADEIE